MLAASLLTCRKNNVSICWSMVTIQLSMKLPLDSPFQLLNQCDDCYKRFQAEAVVFIQPQKYSNKLIAQADARVSAVSPGKLTFLEPRFPLWKMG